MEQGLTTYLQYAAGYRLKNGYRNWTGGYLDASTSGCDESMRAMGDNPYCVSTANYNQYLDHQKDGLGSVWIILSATGKPNGELVKSGDIIYLVNRHGGYLDTRGSGCQSNLLCVSVSREKDREEGTGRWKILLAKDGELGLEIPHQRGFHLLNGWNNWTGGYLDTRGTGKGTNFTGTVRNLLCVSTRAEWDGIDDPNTTAWWAERG